MGKYEQDEMILHVSEFYKTLSDYTRLKIVNALLKGEMCVSDIEKEVGISQTAVSYQLKILRQVKLVKYCRKGQKVYYSIDDEHVAQIIKLTIDHVNE